MTTLKQGKRLLGGSLPILQDHVFKPSTCEGQDTCSTCELHTTWCRGKSAQGCGFQSSCAQGCQTCLGAKSGKLIQGVCCKSPLAPFAIEHIKQISKLAYKRRDPLIFPDERIPVLLDRQHGSPAPVNAIGIHRVYSTKGWKSKDMKDYLKLDASTKLILLTIMDDTYLERFENFRWWEDAAERGFDVWMPLLFSLFANAGNMQNLFSFSKIMRSLSDSQAHMVSAEWGYPQLLIDDEIKRAGHRVQNFIWNASHGSDSEYMARKVLSTLKRYGPEFPDASWFFQGMSVKYKRDAVKQALNRKSGVYFFITPKSGARMSGDQYGWFADK